MVDVQYYINYISVIKQEEFAKEDAKKGIRELKAPTAVVLQKSTRHLPKTMDNNTKGRTYADCKRRKIPCITTNEMRIFI